MSSRLLELAALTYKALGAYCIDIHGPTIEVDHAHTWHWTSRLV
jgi:hypothetical protein